MLKLKTLRLALGKTQTEIAVLIGVAQTTYSQWETETALPRCAQLPALARALNCGIGELFETNKS